MSLDYSLINIRKIVSGQGSISEISEIVQHLNAKNVIIVTDPFLFKSGVVAKIEEYLKPVVEGVHVVTDIPPEPAVADIELAIKKAKEFKCDLIIGMGGGSSMDAAKLVAIFLNNNVDLRDVMKGRAKLQNPGVPTVMIPTTSGTGAEATPNAIVLLPEENLKIGIVDEKMVANAVILDPNMTLTLPPAITAQTGIDALCHAMECYISKKRNPLSDMFALKAINLIYNNIRTAYNEGSNIKARENMLLGACLGGICIATSSTTAVHALSYPLGGTYHIPHGLSNAILLADVMKFNQDKCEEDFKEMALAMGLDVKDLTAKEASNILIDALYKLIADLEISCDLRAKGITEDILDELVDSAAKVTRLLNNNPKEMTKADMKAIYQKLL